MNKSKIKQLPDALQKQFWLRILSGAFFLIAFVIAWAISGELYICLTLLLISLYLIVNGIFLVYNCLKGKYLCIVGICVNYEQSKFFRKVKYIFVEAEGFTLKLPFRKPFFRVTVGDQITLYLSVNMPLCQNRGVYLINSYYAVTIERGITNG